MRVRVGARRADRQPRDALDDVERHVGRDAAARDVQHVRARPAARVQHVVRVDARHAGRGAEAPGAARVAQAVVVRVDDARAQRHACAGQRRDAGRPHDQPGRRPERRVAVDEQAVGDRPLHAVRRIVHDAGLGVAEPARDQRRRAAAVEEHGVARAEAAQQRDQLGAVHADRGRRVAAVDHDQRQRAVGQARGHGGRDAAVALGVVGRARVVHRRPVLEQQRAAADRRRDVRQRRIGVGRDRDHVADVGQRSERLRGRPVRQPQRRLGRERRPGRQRRDPVPGRPEGGYSGTHGSPDRPIPG